MFSKTNHRTSLWSRLFFILTVLLGATSVAQASASLTLAWDANSDSVAGYRLHYGTQSGAYTATVDVGTQTESTISTLANATTYFFAVTAYDADGLESDYSSEVSAVTDGSLPPPPPPPTLALGTTSLPPGKAGEPYTQTISATGGAGSYRFALISGALPVGVLLSADGVLSGTPTTRGIATFGVKVLDDTSSAQRTYTLAISVPAVDPVTFPDVEVGAAGFQYQITGSNSPTKYYATGLPLGLTINSKTGVISGRPTQSGTFQVKLQVANADGSSGWVASTMEVEPLPASAVGTFSGLVAAEPVLNRGVGGRIKLTTTNSGAVTGSLTQGTTTRSFTGKILTAPGTNPKLAVTLNWPSLGSLQLAVEFLPTGEMTGSVNSGPTVAAVDGWNAAPATPAVSAVAGTYTVAMDLATAADENQPSIPQGTGFADTTVTKTGAVTIRGRTADGSVISIGGVIDRNGEVAIYQPLYSGVGSLLGKVAIVPGAKPKDNAVTGTLTWMKRPTITRKYPAGFGPILLAASGKAKQNGSNRKVKLGEIPAVTNTARLTFVQGGLDGASINPSVDITIAASGVIAVSPTNPGQATLSVNWVTGAYQGTFTLVDGAMTRVVPFQGRFLEPGSTTVLGAGYFLLPQIPSPGVKSGETPILSGQVVVEGN